MMTIWKYHLALIDNQLIMMTEGARHLCAQVKNGEICVWALVDPKAATSVFQFAIVGTGNGMNVVDFQYLSTVQRAPFVWHVFWRAV